MAGLLQRIFRRSPAPETRGASMDVLAAAYGYRVGGGAMGPREAESLGAVAASVALISGALSALPPGLVVDAPGGREPAPASALGWRLLRRPTPFLSWPGYMAWTAGQLLTRGNALSVIQNDAAGRPTALLPIPWEQASVTMLPTGRLAYDVTATSYPFGPSGAPRRYLQDETLHIRMRSDDGIIGRSVLARAGGPARELRAIEQLAANNWEGGARPSMALTAPQYLTDAQRKRKQEFVDSISGVFNSGKVAVIEGGWKIEPLSLNSVDSEFLGTREFSVSEIARAFHIPEPLLQLGTRALSDPIPHLMQFAALALSPIAAQIEHEYSFALLPEGQSLVLDMSAMMRGSFSTITSALVASTGAAITTANEARAAMGYARHPDGDLLRVNGAPNWPADFAGGDHLGPAPGPRGDNPPQVPSHQNQGRPGQMMN